MDDAQLDRLIIAIDNLAAVVAAAQIMSDFNGPKDYSDALDAGDELNSVALLKSQLDVWFEGS